ncbi:MAG: hypothetical protein HGA54_00055 [Actinobacteria bacterium]|nr:hypothetical protein [Actinomycetota bacterium]
MKRLRESVFSNAHFLQLMIGFGLYWGWVDTAFFMPTLYHPVNVAAISLSIVHLYVLALSIVPPITVLLIKKLPRSFLCERKTLLVASSCALSGSALMVAYSYLPLTVILVVAIVAAGLGMGLVGIAWGVAASKLGAKGASICIPGTFALAVLFGLIVTNAYPLPATVLTIVFPVISVFLLNRFHTNPINHAEDAPQVKHSASEQEFDSSIPLLEKVQPRFLLILLMFFATFGIMEYLLVLPAPNASEIGHQNILVRGAIALIIFLGTTLFSWKPTVTYKTGFLLMIAGFLAVPFVKSPALSCAVIMVGYTCYDMMAWIVICSLGSIWEFDTSRIISLTRAVGLGGTLLGSLIGLAFNSWTRIEPVNIAIVVTVVVYLLIIATVLILDRGSSGFWSLIKVEGSQANPTQDSIDRTVADISRKYLLTPREGEFLSYLAAGRSIPWVASRLSISDGTGRSHARHIYSKLNVHSRQELLDLIDGHAVKYQ